MKVGRQGCDGDDPHSDYRPTVRRRNVCAASPRWNRWFHVSSSERGGLVIHAGELRYREVEFSER